MLPAWFRHEHVRDADSSAVPPAAQKNTFGRISGAMWRHKDKSSRVWLWRKTVSGGTPRRPRTLTARISNSAVRVRRVGGNEHGRVAFYRLFGGRCHGRNGRHLLVGA